MKEILETLNKIIINNDVTLVIGLPGSGKSTLLKSLSFPTIDDLNKCPEEDAKFHQYLETNTKCVVSCINFCDSKNFLEFKKSLQSHYPNLKIGEIYFENNPHYCALNIIKRSLDRGDKFITLNNKAAMVGEIYNDEPLFELELSKLFMLYKKYKIPSKSLILNLNVPKFKEQGEGN